MKLSNATLLIVIRNSVARFTASDSTVNTRSHGEVANGIGYLKIYSGKKIATFTIAIFILEVMLIGRIGISNIEKEY